MKGSNAARSRTFHAGWWVLFVPLLCACSARRAPEHGGTGDATPTPSSAAAPIPTASSHLPATDGGPVDLAAEATFALPIPARAQAAESPSAGWCGETAIQEGLLYLGVWAPQRLINRAGKPVHPDLYATEIPTALSDLGVRYTFYGRGKGYADFARWVRSALEEGDPVLAGVKILPTEHPDWGLDHFVLAIGHGKKGLLVNTTWGHRDWVADTTTPGLSLKNAFYGIRLQGLKLPANATRERAAGSGSEPRATNEKERVRVTLVEEGASSVKVRVTCMDAKAGQSYRVEARHRDEKMFWSETIAIPAINDGGVQTPQEKELTIEADQLARFRCVVL